MNSGALQKATAAWSSTYDGWSDEEIDQRVRGLAALVRGIAERGAVPPEVFAEETGLPVSSARELFHGLATVGVQLDPKGNVVGAALTTQGTPHRVRVRGQDLFAWCALDTLFIPGFLDETAEVQSRCAATGEEIRLTVSPTGVDECEPPDAVLSVVLPGVGRSTNATGPASPT